MAHFASAIRSLKTVAGRIDAKRVGTMVCDEYKQINGDKRIADECSVIDSPNRNTWLAKSAELLEFMKAHKAECPMCKKSLTNQSL
jgi:hypothetical protein